MVARAFYFWSPPTIAQEADCPYQATSQEQRLLFWDDCGVAVMVVRVKLPAHPHGDKHVVISQLLVRWGMLAPRPAHRHRPQPQVDINRGTTKREEGEGVNWVQKGGRWRLKARQNQSYQLEELVRSHLWEAHRQDHCQRGRDQAAKMKSDVSIRYSWDSYRAGCFDLLTTFSEEKFLF